VPLEGIFLQGAFFLVENDRVDYPNIEEKVLKKLY
jgi:hypothetical protein